VALLEEASGVSGGTFPEHVPLKFARSFYITHGIIGGNCEHFPRPRTQRYFERFQAFHMICGIAGRSFGRFGGRQVDGHKMLF
jgi:hypothetical protein